ncbi:MAG: excinuclease ABC subunit A, partial [Planctomycetaceae bacterium]
AMDTLYAEGQRRYVESLSAYARQFLGQMPRPKVESIQGLSPAIAIEQKTVGATPRSTVGTVTEIYDYLRVLFARLGTVHCPSCGKVAEQQTTDEIVDAILTFPARTRMLVLAPCEVDRQTTYEAAFERLQSNGFVRVRIDGTTWPLEEAPEINHRRSHDIEVVVDRISVEKKSRGRITDSVEAALDLGKGVISVAIADNDVDESAWETHLYSLHLSCFDCGYSYDRPSPQQFSFNSPLGWCWSCEGLGTEYGANQALLISSPESSLLEGAIGAWPDPRKNPAFLAMLNGISDEFSIPLDQPWYLLSQEQQRVVMYGDEERWFSVDYEQQTFSIRYRGIYPTIELAARLSHSRRRSLMEMAGEKDCSVCNGTRLNETAAAVQLKKITLPQLTRMPLAKSLEFLKKLRLTSAQKQIAGDLLVESVHRLTFLNDVGLSYLTLDRSMPTLSGGESQRIRLAGQVGRSLTGVLYVLDEPTIGLHPRDNSRLLSALKRLRDLGNTVLLVEHDREVLESADRLFDFGPGAGRLGGNVVAEGTAKQLGRQSKQSLTGGYLSGKLGIPVPKSRRVRTNSLPSTTGNTTLVAESRATYSTPKRQRGRAQAKPVSPNEGNESNLRVPGNGQPVRDGGPQPMLTLLGATQHNLRNVDLSIPLGTLTCITGVSGSGKSSLVIYTLSRAVARNLNLSTDAPGPYRELLGIEHLSKISIVNQDPIGTTPASNPATYTGVFDHIRELFCQMPDAKVRGYRPGRFSFNRAGGRCDDCEGMGQQKIEMHFLPDVWVECTTCRGRRYNDETLTVHFNGHSIADVLEMPVEKALEVFANVPKIRAPLATLNAIGLGYVTLGQSAPTLSGGEAQRIKLASELSRPNTGRTLYLLDEPTTGLHFDDIAKLLSVLNSLVEKGNTVVVIEHNLDVIKTADWIVDVGPEAGAGGGEIVAVGTPEDVVAYAKSVSASSKLPRSWTGELLAPVLKKSKTGDIDVFDVAVVAKKRSTDLSVRQLGKEAKLPWETDGQRWHTQECLSHEGKRCRWEGAALQYVVDLLAKEPELSPVNWNHRSTVEVKAKNGLGWLLHARTGHEWILSLCFRVKKNTFDTKTLADQLNLTPIDDVEEVHYYSDSPRVKARNGKAGWQEVTIKVWNKQEVDTRPFRSFLTTAVQSYLAQATKEKLNPDDLTPWKQLGRKWHLMKKGLPNNGRIAWRFSTIEKLLPIVESTMNGCTVDYGIRSKINWKHEDGSPAAEMHTKRKDSLSLVLYVPPGSVTIGAIADFGVEQDISGHRSGADAVKITFDGVSQVSAEFRRWLQSNK